MTEEQLVPDWWPKGAKLNQSCTGPCPTCTSLLRLAGLHYLYWKTNQTTVAPDGTHRDITAYATRGAD